MSAQGLRTVQCLPAVDRFPDRQTRFSGALSLSGAKLYDRSPRFEETTVEKHNAHTHTHPLKKGWLIMAHPCARLVYGVFGEIID